MSDRLLRYPTALFGVALLTHNADHIRRGVNALTPQILAAGTLAAVLALTAITLTFARHPLAPLRVPPASETRRGHHHAPVYRSPLGEWHDVAPAGRYSTKAFLR